MRFFNFPGTFSLKIKFSDEGDGLRERDPELPHLGMYFSEAAGNGQAKGGCADLPTSQAESIFFYIFDYTGSLSLPTELLWLGCTQWPLLLQSTSSRVCRFQ